MNMEQYIELGFSSKEEMQLYMDVFAGNCMKEKPPKTLEELLKNLNEDGNIELIPKTKSDYITELEEDRKIPKFHKLDLYTLLQSVANLSEIERLIVIWTYYKGLGNEKRSLFDDVVQYRQEADYVDKILEESKKSMSEEQYLEEYMKLHNEILHRHKVGEYSPYMTVSIKGCNYISSRVSMLGKESQDKFSIYTERKTDSESNASHKVTARDKAFVESMSLASREYREQLQNQRQERYQSMIDESESVPKKRF